MLRRILVLALAAVCAALPCLASFAPPPRPPAGWKDRIAPGFEPSVEASVVSLVDEFYPMYDPAMDAKIHALWNAWGEGAVKLLSDMYADEAWEGFLSVIARLLALSPYNSAHDVLAGYLGQANTVDSRYHYASGALTRYRPELAKKAFKDLVQRDEAQAQRLGMLGLLHLRTPEALAEAKAALDTIAGDIREECRRAIEFNESFARAQEPMARVLEKEENES